MKESLYGFSVEVDVPYAEAIDRVTEALQAAGFGVLTAIDVQQTLRDKLDREFRKYIILGACNPQLASRVLDAELEMGLLLPCNVIVYETDATHSVVAAMAPLAAMDIVGDNQEVRAVAFAADAILRRVLESLEERRASGAS